MSAWKVTVDFLDARERVQEVFAATTLMHAIQLAMTHFGLEEEESGAYQVTVACG